MQAAMMKTDLGRIIPMDRFLSDLEPFINLDTPTADLAACRNAAAFLAARLENAGLSVALHSCGADGRPLLTAVSPSAERSETQPESSEDLAEKSYDFLLVGHFDTVFPTGTADRKSVV